MKEDSRNVCLYQTRNMVQKQTCFVVYKKYKKNTNSLAPAVRKSDIVVAAEFYHKLSFSPGCGEA